MNSITVTNGVKIKYLGMWADEATFNRILNDIEAFAGKGWRVV